MRKTTICLLVLLCSLAAFGQNQPQWNVVHTVILRHQTEIVPSATIFTPTEKGLYRASGYMATVGASNASKWLVFIDWTDLSGVSGALEMAPAQPQGFSQVSPYLFSPKVGTPVTYSITPTGNSLFAVYDVVIIIEQLQE